MGQGEEVVGGGSRLQGFRSDEPCLAPRDARGESFAPSSARPQRHSVINPATMITAPRLGQLGRGHALSNDFIVVTAWKLQCVEYYRGKSLELREEYARGAGCLLHAVVTPSRCWFWQRTLGWSFSSLIKQPLKKNNG